MEILTEIAEGAGRDLFGGWLQEPTWDRHRQQAAWS